MCWAYPVQSWATCWVAPTETFGMWWPKYEAAKLVKGKQVGIEEKIDHAVREIFRQTLALGGTISGEHGIGLEKKEFLMRAMSP